MNNWNIYFEDEYTGIRTFLGTMPAQDHAHALYLAAQYYEVPLRFLVAIEQVTWRFVS